MKSNQNTTPPENLSNNELFALISEHETEFSDVKEALTLQGESIFETSYDPLKRDINYPLTFVLK